MSVARALPAACLMALAGSAFAHAAPGQGAPGQAAADPAAVCARVGTDDALHPLPPGLAEQVRSRFGLAATPPGVIARGTAWRCDGGRALVCFTGANLPCGKLDTRPVLPQVAAWCAQRADGPVPAVVSGHDGSWRCENTRAVRGTLAWHRDDRGFARENWRDLSVGNN